MARRLKPQEKRNAKPKAPQSGNVLLYEVRDEIAFITLNRAEKMNALNGALSDALCATWTRFEADPAAKVAILTGAGKHFCAGADVSPGAIDREVPFQVHQGYPQNGITVFKPIVGAIKGYTLGAGYALAVRGCDITIAGESMLMGFPEARIGTPLPPMEYLPYMPFKISLEFMLLAWNGGQIMDAQRAYEVGLVNKVVADEHLMAEAVRWAELLKKIPPLYIKSVKYGHYKTTDNKVRVDEREYILFTHPQEISRTVKKGCSRSCSAGSRNSPAAEVLASFAGFGGREPAIRNRRRAHVGYAEPEAPKRYSMTQRERLERRQLRGGERLLGNNDFVERGSRHDFAQVVERPQHRIAVE